MAHWVTGNLCAVKHARFQALARLLKHCLAACPRPVLFSPPQRTGPSVRGKDLKEEEEGLGDAEGRGWDLRGMRGEGWQRVREGGVQKVLGEIFVGGWFKCFEIGKEGEGGW